MSEKIITICDLCEQDGEETEAIGWYKADDGDSYDVCEKHGKEVKTAGFRLHLYKEK